MTHNNKEYNKDYNKETKSYPYKTDIISLREKFINRSLSGSYSLKKGDSNFDLYIEEIEKIFDEFESGGIVKIENQTVVYVGTLEKEV